MPHPPLVALISAIPAAISPARDAFDALYPEAQIWNLLDDRLLDDANAAGGLTARLEERMKRLISHALTEGAGAVLLTCSMYTSVAHDVAADADVPVLGPDDAVFAAVRASGYRNVLLVSSGAGPLADSEERLRAFTGDSVIVHGALAQEAAVAARAGDVDALVEAVTSAISSAPGSFDAVVLGQYSLAPSAERVAHAVGLPVLAGPQYAATHLAHLTRKTTS